MPIVPTATLTYAVGDIHGRHDLLVALLDGIRDHAGGEDFGLVFLGDYIDRGPDSAAVLEAVRVLEAERPERVTCLMGNHEHMLLTVLAEPGALPWWVRNGGDTTLASFGTSEPVNLPRDLLDWVSGLRRFHEDGRRYFVHAGLRPGVALPDQTDEDRLWIREPFLSADWDFGRHVVHGHTPLPSAKPDVRRHRTNLDTAAVFGGALSAGVFTPERDQPTAVLRVLASQA